MARKKKLPRIHELTKKLFAIKMYKNEKKKIKKWEKCKIHKILANVKMNELNISSESLFSLKNE